MTEELSTIYSMLYLPNMLLDYITCLVAEATCCDCNEHERVVFYMHLDDHPFLHTRQWS